MRRSIRHITASASHLLLTQEHSNATDKDVLPIAVISLCQSLFTSFPSLALVVITAGTEDGILYTCVGFVLMHAGSVSVCAYSRVCVFACVYVCVFPA